MWAGRASGEQALGDVDAQSRGLPSSRDVGWVLLPTCQVNSKDIEGPSQSLLAAVSLRTRFHIPGSASQWLG